MSLLESPNLGLPQEVEVILTSMVESAKRCFTEDLISVILFGSGAEGRLRVTSDLNLMIVLKHFDPVKVDAFREPWRVACVAARASAMFILESELSLAAETFAVKFDDIGRRHRVLFGADVLSGLSVDRTAKILRLRQILLNFSLRTRERYATLSLREEQLALVIADAAAPLRSAAATLLELEKLPVSSPKEALEQVTCALKGSDWLTTLETITPARIKGALPAGEARPTLFRLMELAEAMLIQTNKLAEI